MWKQRVVWRMADILFSVGIIIAVWFTWGQHLCEAPYTFIAQFGAIDQAVIIIGCLLTILLCISIIVSIGKRQTLPPQTRFIPDWIKRDVTMRDGNQCTHTNWLGKRCKETKKLEYDHIIPWSNGGENTVDNLCLLCPIHNKQKGVR